MTVLNKLKNTAVFERDVLDHPDIRCYFIPCNEKATAALANMFEDYRQNNGTRIEMPTPRNLYIVEHSGLCSEVKDDWNFVSFPIYTISSLLVADDKHPGISGASWIWTNENTNETSRVIFTTEFEECVRRASFIVDVFGDIHCPSPAIDRLVTTVYRTMLSSITHKPI